MPVQVVQTAQLTCTCGAAPSVLTVTSQFQCKVGNMLAATVMDFAPMVNVPPLGVCATLTAAAMGVPTPCVPAPTGPWMPGSTSIVKIGNFQALLNTDKLMCGIGGMISVVNPGQMTTMDT
jgi:hypothetical protein